VVGAVWFAGLGNRTFAHSHFRSLHIFALFKRPMVRSIFLLLFSKKRLSVNVLKKCEFPNRTFSLSKKSDRTFALWLIAFFCSFQKSDCVIALFVPLFKRAIVRSLFRSLFSKEQLCKCSFGCSFQKNDCAIALSVALLKMRMCDRSYCCSFQKSECAIALCKRANEQKCAKKVPISESLFFAL